MLARGGQRCRSRAHPEDIEDGARGRSTPDLGGVNAWPPKQTASTVHLAVPASSGANQAERDRGIRPGWRGGRETDGRERKQAAQSRRVVTLSRDAAEPERQTRRLFVWLRGQSGPSVCLRSRIPSCLIDFRGGEGGPGSGRRREMRKKKMGLRAPAPGKRPHIQIPNTRWPAGRTQAAHVSANTCRVAAAVDFLTARTGAGARL